MKTAITGATGHIGANLVRALLAQNREVRVLVREDRRALGGLDIEQLKGDLADPESLRRLMRGVDTVFNLAARISLSESDRKLVEQTNIEGPQKVVQACLDNGVRRLIHFSSIHAFENNAPDIPVDETRALCLDSQHQAYDRSKAKGQLIVQEAIERGLDAVVINPSAVIGPHDYKPSRMGQVLLDIYHNRLPALIDGGYNWVDVRDVVAGALAAERAGRKGECYLLSGHWVHLRELADLIGKISGRRTPHAVIPIWLAGPLSRGSQVWSRLAGETTSFTPAAVRAVQMHHSISHDKATRELDYRPRSIESTIEDTLKWFADSGQLTERSTWVKKSRR